MKIDLSKNDFTSREANFIIARLESALEKGYLKRRYENNKYLLASFSGVVEKGISPKWNVKIYTFNMKRKGHSLVCVDKFVLNSLLNKDYDSFVPPDLKILRIDDAGWGFPLCGVMVGVSDERTVKTDVVPVEYFRNDGTHSFSSKKYLIKYTDLALNLIKQFRAYPETHRIEICTGYVNQPLREELRKLGYYVSVVEIKGMLQKRLEDIYKKYIFDEIGLDLYYDPKEIKKSEIPGMYKMCVEYGKKHCPHQIKTGWEAL